MLTQLQGNFSIVLMAIVDAHYLFWVNQHGGISKDQWQWDFIQLWIWRGSPTAPTASNWHPWHPWRWSNPRSWASREIPLTPGGWWGFPLRRCLMCPFPGSDISRERSICQVNTQVLFCHFVLTVEDVSVGHLSWCRECGEVCQGNFYPP